MARKLIESDIKPALKLATSSTKDLVIAGVNGNKNFPELLSEYKWVPARSYDVALIIIAYYAYCIKSDAQSLKAFGKTAKQQSHMSFKLLNCLLDGNGVELKILMKPYFQLPMNKILENVIPGNDEKSIYKRSQIIANFVKRVGQIKPIDFDENKKAMLAYPVHVLTDNKKEELKQVKAAFTADKKEAAKNAANIDTIKKQLMRASNSHNPGAVQEILDNNPMFLSSLPQAELIGLLYDFINNFRQEVRDFNFMEQTVEHISNVNLICRRTTLLHCATFNDNEYMVNVLLHHGADPNIQNNSGGETPLFLAVANNNRRILTILLNHDANPNTYDNAGFSPLIYLLRNSEPDTECLDELLRCGADPDMPKGASATGFEIEPYLAIGSTPLHFVAWRRVFAQTNRVIAIKLLNYGADPNIQNMNGETPLYVAVDRENQEMVNVLLDHRADPNIQNRGGHTPLHVVAGRGNQEMVNVLLSHRADPNIQDIGGETPLYVAVDRENQEMVNVLLSHRADPNIQNVLGDTPLHVAVGREDQEMVNVLLSHRADPNIQDRDGETPLHLAALKNHRAIIELLLANGADPAILNNSGQTYQDLLPHPPRRLTVNDFPQDDFRNSFAPEETKECSVCLGSYGADDMCCIFDCPYSEDYPFGHYFCNDCAQAWLNDHRENTRCPICNSPLKGH